MSKRVAAFPITAALVVGAVAGGWAVADYYKYRIERMASDYKHQENQRMIGSLTADTEVRIHQLRRLRAGNITNAIENEEAYLEGDLIGLEPFLTDPNDFKSYPSYLEAVRDVKAYRAEFPYKTNPDVEKGVKKVFTLLDAQTNH